MWWTLIIAAVWEIIKNLSVQFKSAKTKEIKHTMAIRMTWWLWDLKLGEEQTIAPHILSNPSGILIIRAVFLISYISSNTFHPYIPSLPQSETQVVVGFCTSLFCQFTCQFLPCFGKRSTLNLKRTIDGEAYTLGSQNHCL